MKTFLNTAGLFFGLVLLLAPLVVLAQDFRAGQTPPDFSAGNTPPPSSYPFSGPSGGGISVENPLKATSFMQVVQALLQAAIVIGIPIAVLFIVYAGFKFVLALGNPKKLAEAKTNFFYAIIGIAIFLGAWLIAQVIFNTVTRLGAGV